MSGWVTLSAFVRGEVLGSFLGLPSQDLLVQGGFPNGGCISQCSLENRTNWMYLNYKEGLLDSIYGRGYTGSLTMATCTLERLRIW